MSDWEEFTALPPKEKVALVLETMEKVVADHGREFVYKPITSLTSLHPQCAYIEAEQVDGELQYRPSCLVGHVLVRLGASSEKLQMYNTVGILSLPEWLTGLDDDVVPPLFHAQAAQDEGVSWGESFDRARAEAIELGLYSPEEKRP